MKRDKSTCQQNINRFLNQSRLVWEQAQHIGPFASRYFGLFYPASQELRPKNAGIQIASFLIKDSFISQRRPAT